MLPRTQLAVTGRNKPQYPRLFRVLLARRLMTSVKYPPPSVICFQESGRGQFGIFRFADIEEFAVGLAGPVQIRLQDQLDTSVPVTVHVPFLQEGKHDRTIGG